MSTTTVTSLCPRCGTVELTYTVTVEGAGEGQSFSATVPSEVDKHLNGCVPAPSELPEDLPPPSLEGTDAETSTD